VKARLTPALWRRTKPNGCARISSAAHGRPGTHRPHRPGHRRLFSPRLTFRTSPSPAMRSRLSWPKSRKMRRLRAEATLPSSRRRLRNSRLRPSPRRRSWQLRIRLLLLRVPSRARLYRPSGRRPRSSPCRHQRRPSHPSPRLLRWSPKLPLVQPPHVRLSPWCRRTASPQSSLTPLPLLRRAPQRLRLRPRRLQHRLRSMLPRRPRRSLLRQHLQFLPLQ
jgi:hypothetical protein